MKLRSVICIFLISLLLTSCSAQKNDTAETAAYITYNSALVNVCDYGAVPNDNLDDTQAFLDARGQGSVYVPSGVYNISESITLANSSLIGAGPDKTVIIANFEKLKMPIISTNRTCVIRDLTLMYDEKNITGEELMGDRVAIYCGIKGGYSFQRGSSVTNVRLKNVGTGIYAASHKINSEAEAFSVTFDSVTIENFTFRGFDLESELRTGNVYRNIYISSGDYEADAGFYLGGHESETDICNITIENSSFSNTAIRFDEMHGLTATNMNIISTKLTGENVGYIYFNQTMGYINGLNFMNCVPQTERQSFIRLGDNMFRGFTFPYAGKIEIGTLNIMNADSAELPSSEQLFVARKNGYINEYEININNYNFSAPEKDVNSYKKLAVADKEVFLNIERINGVAQ